MVNFNQTKIESPLTLAFIKKVLNQNLFQKAPEGESILFSDLAARKDLIGFYFDASWCKPGQVFLKKLNKVYTEIQNKNIQLEIVYVSFDNNEHDCMHAFKEFHGNWLIWPYGSIIKNDFKKFLSIDYLPCLVVLKSNFEIITSMGRRELEEKGINAVLNWEYLKNKPN